MFVQFHGIWGLHLGAERKPLDDGSLDAALAQMEDEFGPLLRQKLKEQDVRLSGWMAISGSILISPLMIRASGNWAIRSLKKATCCMYSRLLQADDQLYLPAWMSLTVSNNILTFSSGMVYCSSCVVPRIWRFLALPVR